MASKHSNITHKSKSSWYTPFASKVPEELDTPVIPKHISYNPVKLKPFKFKSKWINYQLEGMFRGW